LARGGELRRSRQDSEDFASEEDEDVYDRENDGEDEDDPREFDEEEEEDGHTEFEEEDDDVYGLDRQGSAKVSFAELPAGSTCATTLAASDWLQISSAPAAAPCRDASDDCVTPTFTLWGARDPASLPQRRSPMGEGPSRHSASSSTSAARTFCLQPPASCLTLSEEPAREPSPLADASLDRNCRVDDPSKLTSSINSALTPPSPLDAGRGLCASPLRTPTPARTPDVRTLGLPMEVKFDQCPKGHLLQPYVNPIKASHNTCNLCRRSHIMSPEFIYRCFECDHDVCVACYRGGPGSMSAQAQSPSHRLAGPLREPGPISMSSVQASPGHLTRAALLTQRCQQVIQKLDGDRQQASEQDLSPKSAALPLTLPRQSTPSGYPQPLTLPMQSTPSGQPLRLPQGYHHNITLPVATVRAPSTIGGSNPNEAPALAAQGNVVLRRLQSVGAMPTPVKQNLPPPCGLTPPPVAVPRSAYANFVTPTIPTRTSLTYPPK